MKIVQNVNFQLKEIVNCETATTTINSLNNKEIIVTGFLIGLKETIEEETGEVKNLKIGVLKTDDGQLISTISPTVINSMETIINAYKDIDQLDEIGKGLLIGIKTAKSTKSRNFIFLELI